MLCPLFKHFNIQKAVFYVLYVVFNNNKNTTHSYILVSVGGPDVNSIQETGPLEKQYRFCFQHCLYP